jgi:prepilin-type N-terminal cleavage/methylation domain-containing protein
MISLRRGDGGADVNVSGGFTLIESLVALAIASLVALTVAELLRDGLFYFDRGSQSVDRTEQFALAVDCLSRDLASARFVEPIGGRPQDATFVGEGENRIMFATGGDKSPGAQGEEIVEYTIESDDKTSELVRRRSPWLGPRMRLEDAAMQDPVVVLKGEFDISFRFLVIDPAGSAAWQPDWPGDRGLPRLVRLSLRDRRSGEDLLPVADFPINANAPMSCDVDDDCLSPRKATHDTRPDNRG